MSWIILIYEMLSLLYSRHSSNFIILIDKNVMNKFTNDRICHTLKDIIDRNNQSVKR